ncbi:MAG: DUF389 domain-containing protein, partial [Treponema sp.]|nr:DUF389 domain-containing protein [Treponema sp.]
APKDALITPINEAKSELLARTSPSLYDVLIAFCGGAAGIIAMCSKGKGNVIPGVAIATALMPPLCTAGYGIGTGHLLYFLGAFYLYFINTVFICFATFLGVRLMRFEKKTFIDPGRAQKARRIITSIVIVTMIPALLLTINIVRKSIFENNVQEFVRNELKQDGTEIISTETNSKTYKLQVVTVGREIEENTLNNAQHNMRNYGLEKYYLTVIQGTQNNKSQLYDIQSMMEKEHQENMKAVEAVLMKEGRNAVVQ